MIENVFSGLESRLCTKKNISETELDLVIGGKINEPRYEELEFKYACYDCKGEDRKCELYVVSNARKKKNGRILEGEEYFKIFFK